MTLTESDQYKPENQARQSQQDNQIVPKPENPKGACPNAHHWNPNCRHVGTTYPAIYHPHRPHPLYHLHPLFDHGQVKDEHGKPVCWSSMRNMSVALYFGAGNIRRCRNFLPKLVQFYRTLNEASDRQRIEIIYIPLDESRDEYKAHRSRMPWLSLDFGDKIIPEFKQHFGVFTSPERAKFGCSPRFHPPHLVVIGADGRSLRDLTLENDTERILSVWDYDHTSFF